MYAKAVYLKPNVAILLHTLISTVNVTYAMTTYVYIRLTLSLIIVMQSMPLSHTDKVMKAGKIIEKQKLLT